jgi:hypothetical protein
MPEEKPQAGHDCQEHPRTVTGQKLRIGPKDPSRGGGNGTVVLQWGGFWLGGSFKRFPCYGLLAFMVLVS